MRGYSVSGPNFEIIFYFRISLSSTSDLTVKKSWSLELPLYCRSSYRETFEYRSTFCARRQEERKGARYGRTVFGPGIGGRRWTVWEPRSWQGVPQNRGDPRQRTRHCDENYERHALSPPRAKTYRFPRLSLLYHHLLSAGIFG